MVGCVPVEGRSILLGRALTDSMRIFVAQSATCLRIPVTHDPATLS